MIRYLNHNRIDKARWDDCIHRAGNRRVYAWSWYLDVVCPGWEALVEGEYDRVFPLTRNRKWGVSYLFQPFFTQQLGLFSVAPVSGDQLRRFILAIPAKYRFAEIQLNAGNDFDPGYGKVTRRVNHELDISQNYETLASAYSQNVRRNLRKSKDLGVTPGACPGTGELIGLFRDNFGAREGKLEARHYETLENLITVVLEKGLGQVHGASGPAGDLSAAAFFMFDDDRVYYLFAASSPDARENGAMFSLIDHFLAENAGKFKTLDFEGGNDASLGRFYKSFGAAEVHYPALCINRLPKPLKGALNFIRRHREQGKSVTL